MVVLKFVMAMLREVTVDKYPSSEELEQSAGAVNASLTIGTNRERGERGQRRVAKKRVYLKYNTSSTPVTPWPNRLM